MRVTLVAEQLRHRVPGGIGTYVRGLVRGLAALDHERPFITLAASRPRSHPDPLAAMGFPLVSSMLGSRVLGRLWERGLVGVAPADVIHAPSLQVPWRGKAARTVMVHDLAWRAVPDTFSAHGVAWHEAALALAIEGADLLLAPSDATAEALHEAGVAPDRVLVIEEGCDHLPVPDEAGADAVLERAGVAFPFLITVSTLEPRKNLARLVRAYSLARAQLPEPWPLLVVGPAGWGPRLRPASGVVMVGAVEDAVLAALMGRARCLVYVPLIEGWGLPPVEAMQAGVPVVASPMPSTGGAALDVDPLDVEAIAHALVIGATDEVSRARLVQFGSERAARLRWKDAARRHVAAWERLV